MRNPVRTTTLLLATTILTACGGGGGGGSGNAQNQAPPPQPPPTIQLPPIGETVVSTQTVRGTSAVDLIDYLKDHASGGPWGPEGETWQRWPQLPLWKTRPVVEVESEAAPDLHRMTRKAVDMINDWLPVEHRMIMGNPTERRIGPGCPDPCADLSTLFNPPPGVIHVNFRNPEYNSQSIYDERGDRTVTTDVPYMAANVVYMNPNHPWHNTYGTLVHELIHAMGMPGHVSEYRHPSSIFPDEQYCGNGCRDLGLPDEADLPDLPRIDGEGLMTAYSVYDGGETDADINAASLGPWASTIPVIRADIRIAGGTVSFGAEYRTQWTRAWDTGPVPTAVLTHSGLTGTVEWDGQMIGYTDGGAEARGDATVTVDIAALDGTAAFTSITTGAGSWGSLNADFAVVGNRLDLTDSDPGWLGFDGQFRGTGHEAVTGAFRWESVTTGNMTAAFGGAR